MRRDFKLGITSALAVAVTTAGCSRAVDDIQQFADRDTAVCVDRQGRRVSDNYCSTQSAAHGGGVNPYLTYFIGRNSAVPYYGDSINDPRYRGNGSFRPQAGRSYFRAPASTAITRSAAISRGGFGSSARGSFSIGS